MKWKATLPADVVAAAWVYTHSEPDLQVLNQINGTRSNGIGSLPSVPRLFGLDFQAVSVGQKYAGELCLGWDFLLCSCRRHS